MLPSALRMRSARDFQATVRRGSRTSGRSFVVHLHVDQGALDRRVGIVASAAVGNSVERHLVTRRIRAAIQQVAAELPAGVRVVVRALPGAASAPHLCAEVQSCVMQALGQRP
ncbi:MAG: ribonuclease P protein component [Candidatus Nanopelagicales bacterium]|nr:ribonuclease P protein component [Candidatus Nanopelagicales bacterium]